MTTQQPALSLALSLLSRRSGAPTPSHMLLLTHANPHFPPDARATIALSHHHLSSLVIKADRGALQVNNVIIAGSDENDF